MAYIRNWLHCVWGTKNRLPFITNENKQEIVAHIRANARNKGIYVDFINGYKEHIHCIISLSADQTLSKVMQHLKGESSCWINKNSMAQGKFEWADEYFAVSVSESQLDTIRDYIKNQEEHHRNKTWNEEYQEFIDKYNFKKI